MALDLFAGPGGWDEGVRDLGIEPLGIELDGAACATRAAAGHRTFRANIAAVKPYLFGAVDLLIGSPPCQAYSMAGKGGGRDDVSLVLACAGDLAVGVDTRRVFRSRCADERSLLVLEPLRFALALRPRWIVLEQVPPVIGLWRAFAQILEERCGYRTWAGILSSERYGVPQVRQRAFLMASLDGQPQPPRPTHQEYRFGEPARGELTIDGELLPWVSMAEALGWGATARPTPTAAAGVHQDRVALTLQRRPAATRERLRAARLRAAAEGTRRWLVTNGQNSTLGGGERELLVFDAEERPATTVTTKSGNMRGVEDWPEERPATTLAGDARVFPPGGHKANDGRDNEQMVGRAEGAIRVTVEDAAVLQGFPRDYPFQGGRSKQFEQVGNAVPPPLARAVVAALIGAAA